MEPVINPWLFYFIGVADAIRIFFAVVGASCIAVVWLGVSYAVAEPKTEINKKPLIVVLIMLVVSILGFILVPPSDTLIKMTIAKNVTYDAVDAAKDVVAQVYNDILALFQK